MAEREHYVAISACCEQPGSFAGTSATTAGTAAGTASTTSSTTAANSTAASTAAASSTAASSDATDLSTHTEAVSAAAIRKQLSEKVNAPGMRAIKAVLVLDDDSSLLQSGAGAYVSLQVKPSRNRAASDAATCVQTCAHYSANS